jgi:hypothetical protein
MFELRKYINFKMVEQSKNESSVTQTLAEISLDKSETKEKKPNTAITKL